MENNEVNGLKELFNSLNSVLIILPPNPEEEVIVSALSLHLCLKNSGKSSQIGYSGKLPDLVSYASISELKDSIGNKNLHINLNFLESSLEKVDYQVDHKGMFSLIIQPKAGQTAPEISQIEYSYSGAEADLVIIFAVNSLEELGVFYAQEKRFLDQSSKLLITNNTKPQNFTNHLVQNPGKNYPEIILDLVKKTNLKFSPDVASNLLNLLYKVTTNLTHPKVVPETFESVAFLLRQGANLPGQPSKMSFPSQNSFPTPPFFLKQPFESADEESEPDQDKGTVPSDWQAPKIFRSGS